MGGAASGVALCLAFSKIADKNTGDKALFDIFMIFCVFCQAGAMVCGGASIYSLIKMLGY